MAPVSSPRFRDHSELTGQGINGIISYWPASQKTRWHDARICLGETRTDAFNRFDLCYSFKVLCQAEYGGTQQLHHAAKNYAPNYGLTAGLHQNRRIPYERALRNLVVLMFSHYVNHLECTGSLEGHQTLMVHECLVVAAALGRYHRWQRRVNPQDRDAHDWTKVPVVPKDDFRHKYSPALTLLGNAQNPTYAHPKLLGRCFDNVYFCGRIIGDLPARGRAPHSEEEDKWAPRPEMTPRKVERGRQPGRDQDSSSRPPSQKRRSQSRPRDEASAKKGRTDGDNWLGKIQVGIDWANMGIGKPVPKPDSKHPSFKADPFGVDEPQPRMRSTVTKPKQPSETQEKDSGKKKEDAEKKVLQDKPHRWIEAHVKRLDLGGYLDEVKSLRYFGRNACDFAMGIVAIADWGRRYLDKGLKYPISTIPPYLFTPLPESCQSGAQVPVKPSQLGGPGGHVRQRCRESWKWLVTVLQFWTDEATVADGAMYGGRVRPASALAQYVMDTVNPGLEPGSKVSWEDVITRTPWLTKRLHGMTTGQEQTVRRQALPMPGESSELEVLSEKLYTQHCKKLPSAGRGKSPLGRAGTLRLHLKKVEKGWTQASQSGTGPGVGNPNWYPKEESYQPKPGKSNRPGRSPLTNELLEPDEELLGELDYEDVEEINPEPDPEIAQAIAHIPKVDVCDDVEMQDVRPPLGFEPEVVKAGYDVNLVHSDQPELGSSSPVTAGEDRMLDVEESQPRAPGNGRPGHNPGQAAEN